MKKPIFTITVIIISSIIGFAQETSESVFYSQGNKKPWILYENNNQALYKIITNEAFDLLDKREARIKELNTKEDWKNYQQELSIKFKSPLEKFQKTPLNAKVTGKLERDKFTVEKIIFESHPGFFVTAAMFIPNELKKPAPAVIYCSGHTELGFRSDVYQKVMINLVEKGFVVFAFDPIGQGERLQYVDPETGKSKVGGPTTEHSYAGIQTLLAGTSLSDYFIWDGVRAIDYLETRPEVDMNRIGITGRSGGGTQSALIAAYDERIYAAAPECYITSFKRLLQSIGPQDAEQNPYNFIKNGMDHADFLHIRAPKPALIITTTHDFFSQQGARETFTEVQKSYNVLGKPGNIQFTEDLGVHESTKNNRETLYAFFQNQLQNAGDDLDLETTPFKYEELLCTPTGQVATSLRGETVFSLNRKYFSKKTISEEKLKQKIKEISGVNFNRKIESAVFTGRILKDNFAFDKYFLENSSRDFALPFYMIKKENSANKIMLWLSTKGKQEILENQHLENYLNEGFCIVASDLPGIGELHDPEFKGDGFVKNVPFNYTFGANLVGKSIPGIQAEAIDFLVQFVQKEFPEIEIQALIENEISTAIIVYASQKNIFTKIKMTNALEFNQQFIETEKYDPEKAFQIIPGSLSLFNFKEMAREIKTLDLE